MSTQDSAASPLRASSDYSNQRWKAFLPIALVSIITTLDSSVVNVSLPIIAQQLKAGIGVVQWVVLAYLLAVTSLLMIFGRLGDLIGRRRIYQMGIVLFTFSSALCGFSQNITMLIFGRALQGTGAALLVAVGPALIGEIFPPQQRGKALGFLGTTVSVGLSVGPAVGGFITGWLGWRYIFFLNLPLGVLAVLLVRRHLRSDGNPVRTRFDFVGAATMAGGMLCLMLALSRGSDWGWSNPVVINLLLAAWLLLTLFFISQSRLSHPILDLKLFKNPIFRSATSSGFLAFAALFSQTFLLPFYLIQLRGFPPAHAGLFLMSVPSMMAVVAPSSGSFSDRIGTRGLCVTGLFLLGIGFILLSTLTAATPQPVIVSFLLVVGLGVGMFNPPNNADLLSSVPRERLGNASGMMGLTRTLGMVTGVALSGAIFLGVRKFHLGAAANLSNAAAADSAAFLSGLHWAFRTAAALAWTGMIMVWGRGKFIRGEQESVG
jgi:EmrB/QacA subfamily drug resistance transporter